MSFAISFLLGLSLAVVVHRYQRRAGYIRLLGMLPVSGAWVNVNSLSGPVRYPYVYSEELDQMGLVHYSEAIAPFRVRITLRGQLYLAGVR